MKEVNLVFFIWPTFSILLLACGPEKARIRRGTIQFKSPFSTFYKNIKFQWEFFSKKILLHNVHIHPNQNFQIQKNHEASPKYNHV
jgi:hypothetical protein